MKGSRIMKNVIEKSGVVKTESEKPYEIAINLDDDLRKVNVGYSAEEKEALEIRAKEVGHIEETLIGWEETHTLIWGYTLLEIAEKNNLPYGIDWKSFATKQDALAEAVDRKMTSPIITRFEKIEDAKLFGEYWQEKLDRQHPVCVLATKRNKGALDVLGIVGVKAGASRSTVNKVNRILDSKDEALITQCRKGEISISAAFDLIKGTDEPEHDNQNSQGETPNGDDPQKETPGNEGAQEEVPEEKVTPAEKKRKDTRRKKEANILAQYSVKGFSNGEKLTKAGRKFFLLRWNDEHTDNCMSEAELETAIKNYGKEK